MMFCPKCKKMMYPKDGKFVCACGYIENIENADELKSKSKIKDNDVLVLEGDEGEALPTTTVRCPECGHDVAYWWLRQLRSADESETRFFRCAKCKFTWREYD